MLSKQSADDLSPALLEFGELLDWERIECLQEFFCADALADLLAMDS
jgi:hypothetical protein